ncbi:hypothetical protein VNO78_08895 [Psophocarpus tetragonolobus]|uniref:Uncharacterized protein n=1 Tax=Psophocarpus tetragonolobus TaxID=3891 RepID=A0AAN9SXT5_PSOTE
MSPICTMRYCCHHLLLRSLQDIRLIVTHSHPCHHDFVSSVLAISCHATAACSLVYVVPLVTWIHSTFFVTLLADESTWVVALLEVQMEARFYAVETSTSNKGSLLERERLRGILVVGIPELEGVLQLKKVHLLIEAAPGLVGLRMGFLLLM